VIDNVQQIPGIFLLDFSHDNDLFARLLAVKGRGKKKSIAGRILVN